MFANVLRHRKHKIELNTLLSKQLGIAGCKVYLVSSIFVSQMLSMLRWWVRSRLMIGIGTMMVR